MASGNPHGFEHVCSLCTREAYTECSVCGGLFCKPHTAEALNKGECLQGGCSCQAPLEGLVVLGVVNLNALKVPTCPVLALE